MACEWRHLTKEHDMMRMFRIQRPTTNLMINMRNTHRYSSCCAKWWVWICWSTAIGRCKRRAEMNVVKRREEVRCRTLNPAIQNKKPLSCPPKTSFRFPLFLSLLISTNELIEEEEEEEEEMMRKARALRSGGNFYD
ncbi:unnamed protein product [Sphenostylis stenocarpa]|uniref:Uncharacterized protein n=1 Tax=Sphenostylis stenocarpa TaxID=92480 RepID=A0AA86T3Z2_9FABA|nr:unnamed protein product [Sphenostylis stenocarpa]